MENLVIAFAFGVPSTLPSNKAIAAIANVVATTCECQIFTQSDAGLDSPNVILAIEEEGAPPPTLRIAREAAVHILQHDVGTIWIVAARPHLWRCIRDTKAALQALNQSSVQIKVPWKLLNEYNMRTWLCLESNQPRTRSWWNWWSREVILMLIPFWLYQLVAS